MNRLKRYPVYTNCKAIEIVLRRALGDTWKVFPE
jgi:hypothetical protein